MGLHFLRIVVALFVSLITAALIGCAVTKIDVDVYKGPMANHQDVQTEQLAALLRLRQKSQPSPP